MSYKVKLELFEGPFDLLVYLIENARMDIYDIKVAEITSQYLEYMEQIKNVDVDTASEFMVLAANLIEIKSKMLLPSMKHTDEAEEEDDPRADLVERILEYKKYKRAAELFRQMEEQGSTVLTKPAEDVSGLIGEPEEILTFNSNTILNAYSMLISRKRKLNEIKYYEHVKKKKITSQERVGFIRKLFELNGSKEYNFRNTLQKEDDKYDMALSFTTLMEMVKQKQIAAKQEYIFGDIFLRKGMSFDDYDDNGRLVADVKNSRDEEYKDEE